MASMSDYLRDQVLKTIFLSGSITVPITLIAALCASAPVASDTGDLTGKEIVGNGYIRVEIGGGSSNWTDPDSTGTLFNKNLISFPAATADWTRSVTHVAIVDDMNSGNLLFYGELDTPKTIFNGDILQFDIGQLAIQLI